MTLSSLYSLSGKVAFVTGGSRGLGLAMARGFAEAGALVIINGRSRDSLESAADSIRDSGGQCYTAAFDATDEVAARKGLVRITKRYGAPDIVVANAGLVNRAPLGEWTLQKWDEVMNANLRASFFLAEQAATAMKAKGDGRIIFTSSLTGLRGRATLHAYAASKAGLASLARSFAAELGEFGITANAIAPGYFETDLNDLLLKDEAFVARITQRTALKRWGRPAELAGVALLLASPAGGYITGQQIIIDGGIAATM